MRNVMINYAESIFEPFWDCGESYPNHHKYSLLAHYTINTPNTFAHADTTWCGVSVSVDECSDNEYDIILKAECGIDSLDFDTFRLFGAVPESVKVRVNLETDRGIISNEFIGKGETDEYTFKIKAGIIYRLELCFKAFADYQSVQLFYLGLGDSKRKKFMESIKSPYDEGWEGCFKDDFEICPQTELYFSEDELEELRKKLKAKPFSDIMTSLREQAEKDLNIYPEKDISTFIINPDRRWVSPRDLKRTETADAMERLAFVGIVDKNVNMLRLACRMALCAAHCTYWCESIMGVFPGATWHHRSFMEEQYSKACSLVLDWAGGLLTWHGKNIIYDAIIMKGLPRIEADFMTMDYIRHMNQGLVFSSGRIMGLITLSKKYPRYEKRLDEAERDLFEMLDDYFDEDGGMAEGPAYWNYTLFHVLPLLYVVAHRRGKTIKDILTEKLRKTVNYGLCMLSDEDNGRFMLPVNDSHKQEYNPIISAVFAQIDEKWKQIYSRMTDNGIEADKEFLILAKSEKCKVDSNILSNGVISSIKSGQISLRRKMSPSGTVHLHLVSGKTYFAHTHGDKGSFILELDGEPVFIDRGMTPYGMSYSEIQTSQMHNCFVPTENGKILTQPKFNVTGGKITRCVREGMSYVFETDITDAWEKGRFELLKRKIISYEDNTLIIEDTMHSKNQYEMCFYLNTLGEIEKSEDSAVIITKNHKAVVKFDTNGLKGIYAEPFGMDENMKSVNRLCLKYNNSNSISIRTIIKFERRQPK